MSVVITLISGMTIMQIYWKTQCAPHRRTTKLMKKKELLNKIENLEDIIIVLCRKQDRKIEELMERVVCLETELQARKLIHKIQNQ
tara:strand:+ start:555 stop:812 length:258 start_codon:yes stop_codon:yes gene_type:complete